MAELGEANIGGRLVPAWLLNLTAEELDGLKWHSNRNLLDNWYFGNPVNQRGQTEYTGSGYAIDRWSLTSYSNQVIYIMSDCIRLKSTGDYGRIIQKIPADITQYIKDKTVTISLLTKNTKPLMTLTRVFNTMSGGVELNFDFKIYTIVGDDGTSILYLHQIGNNVYTDIIAVKLELGSQQTLAHQDVNGNWVLNELPNYADMLARCQAYLWVPQQKDGFTILGVGHAENANTAWVTVVPSVSMRTGGAPTVKISDVSALNLRGSSIVTATGVFVDQATNGTPILLRVEGTFTPGEAFDVFLSNSASIEFSREL